MNPRFLEQVFIDVKVDDFDLQILVEMVMDFEKEQITEYEVWTTAKNCTGRFFAFGGKHHSDKQIYLARLDIIEEVKNNFDNGNINFDDIIDYLDADE